MRPLSGLPSRRLYAVLAAIAVLALSGGIAQATLRNSDPKPPARPLALAAMDAVQSAQKLEGLSAQIHFTNNLLPAGTLPPGTKSPLAAGADGHLWLARDGRFRLDLTSSDGDAQIVSDGHKITVYDQTTKSVYSFGLPAEAAKALRGRGFDLVGMGKALGPLLDQVTISGAKPTSTAGRPTYTVRIAPKDDGGLLAAAEVAWDAEKGVPLRAAVYAQGNDDPVLELKVTDITYGRVADADLRATPHPGAKTVEVDGDHAGRGHARLGGPDQRPADLATIDRRVGFHVVAPDELAGLTRGEAHVTGSGADAGVLITYGKGLGGIVVFEGKTTTKGLLAGLPLPEVNIDGGTGKELATALGTIVTFERGGVSYAVAGLVPPVAAENAARGLR
jgi:outer membrane lipoprotein-sorting protein